MFNIKKSIKVIWFTEIPEYIARLSIEDPIQGTELKIRIVPFLNDAESKANANQPEKNRLNVDMGPGLGSVACFYIPYDQSTDGEARVFAHDEAKRLFIEAKNKEITKHNALPENEENQIDLWVEDDIEIVL